MTGRSVSPRWLAVLLLLCAGIPETHAATGLEVAAAGHLRGCGFVAVTVAARNGDGSVDTAYTGRVVFNAGVGGAWLLENGAGVFEGAPMDGEAAYTFAAADQGVANFMLNVGDGPAFAVNVAAPLDGLMGVSRAIGSAPYSGSGVNDALFGTWFNFVPHDPANNTAPTPEPPNDFSATATSVDGPLNFPASGVAPLPGVNANGFATNWTGVWRAPVTGQYRFHIFTYNDDGVRLDVDGSRIINKWNDNWVSGQHVSAIVNLAAGSWHDIRIHYYQRWNNWSFRFAVERVGFGGPATIPANDLRSCAAGSPPLPARLAEYRLEELSWSGTSNDVTDSSGNGNHGLALGAVSSSAAPPAVPGDPGSCRMGVVPENTNAARAGFDTGINPGTDIGRAGTIAFWYRPNFNWGSGRRRYLLDASTVGGGSFALFLEGGGSGSGQIHFDYIDPALPSPRQTFWSWAGYPVSAGQWVHIAFSWDFDARVIKLYVRDAAGNLLTNGESTQTMSAVAGMAALGSLVIGDNASTNDAAWRAYGGSHPGSMNGAVDEVQIYSSALPSNVVANFWSAGHPCSVADHFQISHAAIGVNCEAAPVTIRVHDASDAVFSGYSGTITLSTSTSHGDWSLASGNGTLTNSGSGDATYTFAAADNGVVGLRLSNANPETLNIDVSDGSISEDAGEDDDLEFKETGFIVTSDYAGGVIPVQISGKPSDQDYNKAALKLKAVRTDNNTGACAAVFDGEVTVKVAADCINPSSCTPDTMNFDGGALAISNGATPSYSDVKLTFDPASFDAPFVFTYNGAAELQFLFRYALDSSNTMSGASNKFVVRPFAMDVQATSNPAATGPSGSKYVSAGTPFKTKLRAVAWQAADDINKDGVADGHDDSDPSNNATLSDNATVESFALMGATHEEALLSSGLVAPSGGNSPALAGSTSFTSYVKGVSSEQSVRFDEVGIIELAAGLKTTSYMGISAAETAKIKGRSGYVGRFSADHFTTVISNHGCSDTDDFTYSGQPIAKLELEARNAQNGIVTNYEWDSVSDTGFARNTTISDPNGSSPGSVVNGGVSQKDFVNGVVELNDVAFKFTSVRLPYDLIVRATDTDSASSENKTEATTEIRAARLVIDDAFSPDFQPARASIRVESYQATSATTQDWELESQDACTALTLAANLSLDMFDPPVAGVTGTALSLTNGSGAVDFSPAGAGNEGSLRATLLGPAWLKFDWNGGGAENPSAKISYFGIYETETGYIYRREIY